MKITILACIAIIKQFWVQIKYGVLFPENYASSLQERLNELKHSFDFMRPCEIYPFYKGCSLNCCTASKFECWKEFVSNPNIDWD